MLRRIPSHFPSITDLTIDGNNSGLPLEDLLRGKPVLRSLVIKCFQEVVNFPNTLLQSYTSLEKLTIYSCKALVSIPDLQCLSKLTRSDLGMFSEELDYFPCPYPVSSIRQLELVRWPKLQSLPEQFQHLSSLTHLTLQCFHGLKALPYWLGNLSSL